MKKLIIAFLVLLMPLSLNAQDFIFEAESINIYFGDPPLREKESDFTDQMTKTRGSAVLYPQASSVDATDQVLGIIDPTGVWSIQRVPISIFPVDPDQIDGDTVDDNLLDSAVIKLTEDNIFVGNSSNKAEESSTVPISSIAEEIVFQDADLTGTVRFAFNTSDDRLINLTGDANWTLPPVPIGKAADHDIWQCYTVDGSALDIDGVGALAPASKLVGEQANYPQSRLIQITDADNWLTFKYIAPANWDGATIYVGVYVHSEAATPSGTVEFEVQTQARGTGEAFNATWTTIANIQFASAIATKWVPYFAESSSISASGAGDDLVYIKLHRDYNDGTNDTSTDAVYLHTVKICFQIEGLDER